MVMHTIADLFLNPQGPMPTQYEALRAHFVDGQPVETVTECYEYSFGGFRNLCSRIRKKPNVSDFFAALKP